MARSDLLPLLLGPIAAVAVLCLIAAWTFVLLIGLAMLGAVRWLTTQ